MTIIFNFVEVVQEDAANQPNISAVQNLAMELLVHLPIQIHENLMVDI